MSGPNLAEPTRYPITVLLPDDQVLVTGGSRYYRGMHGSDNRDTRIYNVATNTFSWAANSITGRDYHSGGILLPNGSVLTLGGNPLFGNAQDTDAADLQPGDRRLLPALPVPGHRARASCRRPRS